MSSGQMWYGSLKPQYFLLVDSTGARVANHTFVAGDVTVIDTGQALAADEDVFDECLHVSSGLYKWTPTYAGQSQVETVVVLITDTGGSTFVDNAMIIQTGGNAAAYFDAGL